MKTIDALNRITAIILAAGLSSRMGGVNKLLLPFKGKTILESVVQTITSLPFAEVIVVSGHDQQAIGELLRRYPVTVADNPDFSQGLSTSLRRGVDAADPHSSGYLFCLADMPLLSPNLLKYLCKIFLQATVPSIVVPVYDGRRGNPVIFSSAFRDELLQLQGDQGARPLLDKHPRAIIEVPVNHPGVSRDIDTDSQYRELREMLRPYPEQYIRRVHLHDGRAVTLRPIRPSDEPLMIGFHQSLSDQTVYYRYFHPVALRQRVAHERLVRICFIDYDREMVLVAEHRDPQNDAVQIIAVGRLNKLPDANAAEFAIVISDGFQGQGLGTKILSLLVEVGRDAGLERIVADILPDNRGMQRVAEKVGFSLRFDHDEQVTKAELNLRD